MECWGARGGGGAGGNGGYVAGDISLNGMQKLYVYVGEKGSDAVSSNTFNNGTCTNYTSNQYGKGYGYAGGGASDIRLKGGNWNDFESLKNRFLIAGGGGGAGTYYARTTGGYAGGLTGGSGTKSGPYGSTPLGGSQIAGGTSISGVAGVFGIGGNSGGTGKGGGGYYGGAGACHTNSTVGAGGGGSSFISGHSGCNAVSASSTSTSIVHTGQSVHYSGLYFTNTRMVDGAGYQWTTARGSYVGMPNFAGTGTMSGNTTHGQIKITPLN